MLARWRATQSVRRARQGGTEYLQVVQNWGAQAGARTDHLCIDIYDLPQIPHRIGEELGGAARYVIQEGVCPWCRLVRDEVARRDRLVFEDAASVCFAPYASRSPFELWVVPRHHEADFGRATDDAARRRRGDAAQGPAAARRARRAGLQPGAAHGARSTSASTRRTTGTGRSTRGCARSPGSSWAPACRSTRSARRKPSRAARRARTASGGRRTLAAGTPSRAAEPDRRGRRFDSGSGRPRSVINPTTAMAAHSTSHSQVPATSQDALWRFASTTTKPAIATTPDTSCVAPKRAVLQASADPEQQERADRGRQERGAVDAGVEVVDGPRPEAGRGGSEGEQHQPYPPRMAAWHSRMARSRGPAGMADGAGGRSRYSHQCQSATAAAPT